MYTLRVITNENVQQNYFLGKSYTLINGYEGEKFKEAIASLPKSEEKDAIDSPHVYAVLIPEVGDRRLLWSDNGNYVMIDNGRTFANLTLR